MSVSATITPEESRGSPRLLASLAGAPVLYGVILAAAFVAMFVTALLSYRAIDRELSQAALSRSAALAELAAVTLAEKLDRLVDIAVSLADRVRFRELIAENRWVEAMGILARVRSDFPVVDRIVLFDPGGTLRADIPEVAEVMGRNFATRDWYKGVSREWKPYVSSVYQRAAAPAINVFGIAVPIRAGTGALLGALLLQVRLDTLFEWTRGVDIGEEGFLYVVDRTGTVAFHPRFPAQEQLVELSGVLVVKRALEGRKGIEISASGSTTAEASVKAYQPLARYGWAVIAEQPARAAFATRDHQLRYLLLAYGMLALLCVVAAYLASRIVIERRQADEDRRLKSRLERLVTERTAQLEEANRELESFSYSVSHDLRSPLRAIDGFARILTEDHGERLDDEGRRLLGVVRDNSRKMGELIDDLLEFSRLGRKPLAASLIDMKRLVEDVLAELDIAAKSSPLVVVGVLPPVQGDVTLVKQVWVNLLTNAVKFSGRRERPVIEVSGKEDGRQNVYCVKDNGAGFDMQYYDKLFGVFQRLHGATEFPGTGVGLAIVQRVVMRHGGKVWAEGKVNEGAAFYFSMPREGRNGSI